MRKINITCKLIALEDFHVGTGIGNIGLYDEGQVKDAQNHPIILPATFKGLLRDACAQYLIVQKEFGIESNDSAFRQLFEDFSNLSSLDIAIKPLDNAPDSTIIHFFTAIDDTVGIAQQGSLRSLEFASKSLQYEITIDYLVRDDTQAEITRDFIINGLKMMKSIGGYRRRGFGAVDISELSHTITEITPSSNIDNKANTVKLLLELADDTIFSTRSQSGNLLLSNDYIPGSTILGMFRSIMLVNNVEETYLDDDSVIAEFFYPFQNDEADFNNTIICPIPFSIRKQKSYQKSTVLNQGIQPWALNRKSSNKLSSIISQNTLFPKNEAADVGKGMYEGYIYVNKTDKDWQEAVYYNTEKILIQRNSIDEKTQSTQDNGVFIEERIRKGSRFTGSLKFKNVEQCSAFLRDFHPWLSGDQPLHAGRGGKPVIVKRYKVDSEIPDIANHEIKKEFTITFLSDVILFDAFLNPLTTLTEQGMADLMGDGVKNEDLRLLAGISRTGVISSFSGISGLRKFRDIAIRKGSCFRFEISDSNDGILNAIWQSLRELEKTGIGIRKNEGFGRIAINHPIHKIAFMETAVEPELCDSLITQEESKRLADIASMHNKSIQIAAQLSYNRKGKWKSVVGDLIIKLDNGIDLQAIKGFLKNKQLTQDTGKDKKGKWGKDDSRYKIAEEVIKQIDNNESPKVISTALKLMSEGKGVNNA